MSLCFPLFFVLPSEVFKSSIKSCFEGVTFSRCSYNIPVLYLTSKGISREKFFVIYCCKFTKTLQEIKKFLQSRLFICFFALCKLLPEIKEVFKLVARKFHFLSLYDTCNRFYDNYIINKKHFKRGSSLFFEHGKLLPEI